MFELVMIFSIENNSIDTHAHRLNSFNFSLKMERKHNKWKTQNMLERQLLPVTFIQIIIIKNRHLHIHTNAHIIEWDFLEM